MNPFNDKDEELSEDLQPMDDLLKSLFRMQSPRSPSNDFRLSPGTDLDQGDEPVESDPLKSLGRRFGPFEIRRLLGIGSYGVVYQALNIEKGGEVALKLPRSDLSFSESTYRRFKREPRFLNKLDHPSIVALVETGMIGHTFYIATEYQPGCDLKVWMNHHRTEISEQLVVEWGLQLSDALEHANVNGVVHRDLKPSNIIIVENPTLDGLELSIADRYRPKITDFGLAFSMQEPMLGSTATGAIVGTLGYMPPEQVMSGNNRADIRGDIYAMGIILAELALGRPIRKQDNIIDYIVNFNQNEETVSLKPIRQLVRPDLYAILKKCIHVNPARRYQRPGELHADLLRLKKGLPLDLQRSNSRENIQRMVRKNPILSISVVLSFLFLTIFSISQYFNQKRLGRSFERVEQANTVILKQNSEMTLANRALNESQQSLRRTAYNSALRLGYSEMRDGRLESVHDLLDEKLRIDAEGEPGLNEFGWRYLNHLASGQYRSHMFRDFDFYLPGSDTKKLGQLYQNYITFLDSNRQVYGHPHFFGNGLGFDNETTHVQFKDHFRIVYQPYNEPGKWLYLDGQKSEKLVEAGKFDEVLFSPDADRFYYFTNRDSADQSGNGSVEVRKSANRTSYYFNGFRQPVLTGDGNIVAGLCRLKPGSGKMSYVIYDTKREKLVETGLEVADGDHLMRYDLRPELSQTGRLAGFKTTANDGIFIFDLAAGRLQNIPWEQPQPGEFCTSLGIDEERGLVVAGDYSGRLQLWKIGEKKPLAEFPQPMVMITKVGFLPSGQIFFLKQFTERIWIWDPFESRREPIKLDHTDEVWSLEFDQAGRFLVSGGDDGKVILWDMKTNQGRVIGTAESLVTKGRFSPDETLFAACDYSGFVRVWETKQWKLIKTVQVNHDRLRSLAWGPGNEFLVCVGKGRDIMEFRLQDDSIRRYTLDLDAKDVVYSKASAEFLVGCQSSSQKLIFMQFPGGKVVSSLDTGRSPTRFAVDPISQRIIVGFNEGGFGLVSLKDHKIERYVGTGQSDGEVIELTFTADGRNVITTVEDKRALIYETENWEKVGFMNEHQSKIHAIAVSPDGKKLATGDMTGKINVLEIPDQPVLK